MVEIFVSAAGEIDEDDLVFRALFRFADGGGERMGTFQCRDDAFIFAQELEGLNGFPVRDAS